MMKTKIIKISYEELDEYKDVKEAKIIWSEEIEELIKQELLGNLSCIAELDTLDNGDIMSSQIICIDEIIEEEI